MASTASCSAFKLLSSTLEVSSEAVFLLTSGGDEGHVVFQNSAVSTLFGGHAQTNTNGDNHKILFSSFVSFDDKSWQDIMMELADHQSTTASSFKYNGTGMIDSSSSNNFDKKEFPVSVTLKQIEPCSCCNMTLICAYVRARDRSNNDIHHLTSIRDLVDASFDPMFQINSHGIITMVNDAALTLFGYTYQEFIGQNIKMICGGNHSNKHDEYLARYLKTGETRIIGTKREVPAKKKDGSEFYVELGIKEIYTAATAESSNGENRAFCAFIKDLTDQKEHEKQVQLKEMLTQSMVNSSFDPMFQVDEMGNILMVNDAAVDMFGWSRTEFIGNNIKMICGDGHSTKHEAYMERYRKTGIKHIIGRKRNTKARRKDGSEFDIELGISESKAATLEGKSYFCGYVRDITRQKLDRQRLRANEAIMKDGFFSGGTNGIDATNVPPAASPGADTHGKVRGRRLRHAQTTI